MLGFRVRGLADVSILRFEAGTEGLGFEFGVPV